MARAVAPPLPTRRFVRLFDSLPTRRFVLFPTCCLIRGLCAAVTLKFEFKWGSAYKALLASNEGMGLFPSLSAHNATPSGDISNLPIGSGGLVINPIGFGC